jgi:hypothetical protein
MQKVLSYLFFPLIAPALFILKHIRKSASRYYPVIDMLFDKIGIYPVANHYYNPFVIPGRDFKIDKYNQPRHITTIAFNEQAQLELLKKFSYQEELLDIEHNQTTHELDYNFKNGTFEAGDAEIYYNYIRWFKPATIIEIGSGNSSKMAAKAIHRNREEDPGYAPAFVCIEPYEMPWLEKMNINVFRKKAEEFEPDFFKQLKENDILFIDSSHVIRPEGDVLFEYMQVLPALNKGVIIHIHDIFTPFHYPIEWIRERRMWNEQYLLEAFLSYNDSFEIMTANNFLKAFHYDAYARACPVFNKRKEQGVGSFWIRKVK